MLTVEEALQEILRNVHPEAETEEKDIQRLSHLGIHSIYRDQNQTLLLMPRSAC